MIPAMLFVGVTFDRTWLAFRRVFGKKMELVYLPLLLAVPLIFIVRDNYNQYFGRWVTGLDELATGAGMYTEKIEADKRAELGITDKSRKLYRVYLYTGLYYPGHPPFRVYRWDYKVNSSDDMVDGITNLRFIDDEPYAILFHYDVWDVKDFWADMFPGAKWDVYAHEVFGGGAVGPDGKYIKGKAFDAILIDTAEIKSKRGLSAIYTGADGAQSTVENDFPEFSTSSARKFPYKVLWKGTLLMPNYSNVVFVNKGTAKFTVYVDGRKYEDGKEMKLAKGFNRIQIQSTKNSPADTLDLYMSLNKYHGLSSGGSEVIKLDAKYLYTIPVHGFHSYYYSGGNWEPDLVHLEEIEPELWSTHMITAEPGSAKWKAVLDIEKEGKYQITGRADGGQAEGFIVIGDYYWASYNSSPSKYPQFNGKKKVDSFYLTKGKHEIEIYCRQSGRFLLEWKGPGMDVAEPVPSRLLDPVF
jgi:hypothetical protein